MESDHHAIIDVGAGMTNQVSNTIDLLLAQSFKEIAVNKPIEKITIKEITDLAGVIRPTFYNHFQDKYELMEWIIRMELLEPMRPLLLKHQFADALYLPMEALIDSKAYYMRAARLEGQNSFEESLRSQISNLILECIPPEKLQSKLPYAWLTPQRTADYFAAVISDAVMCWILSGMEAPKEEFADVFLHLCFHSIAELIGDLHISE